MMNKINEARAWLKSGVGRWFLDFIFAVPVWSAIFNVFYKFFHQ
jgi:hypothetical protein